MTEPTIPTDPIPSAEDNLQRVVVVMTHLDKDPQKSLGRNFPIFGQCGMTSGPDGSLTVGSHGRAVAIYANGQWKMAQEVIIKKPTERDDANVEAFPQPAP